MIDLYVAQVKLPENGIIIKIDQSHLETVIPALESTVAIGTDISLLSLHR